MRRREARLGAGLAALALGLLSIGTGVVTSLPASAAEDEGTTQAPEPDPSATPSEAPDPSEEPLPSPSTDPSPSEDPEPSSSPSASPTQAPEEGGRLEVDDAVFTWSMNQQAQARSHNPLTINSFGAGTVEPRDAGGQHLVQEKGWRASAGNVRIEKRGSNGAWRTASWAGLETDATGKKIGVYGPFSGHRVRLLQGSGVLDPAADDADLRWKGTWTVIFYGGNTAFTLTDPQLEVTAGKGRLTAVLGGWASTREDMSKWAPVPTRRVPVAELTGVDVTATGLTVTPQYRGRTVTGTEKQVREGADWGAFPQEMVTFLGPLGVDQFWYSTGLRSDWTKLPTPIAVGYAGKAPEAPAPTTPRPSTSVDVPEVVAPPKAPRPTRTPTSAPTAVPGSGTPLAGVPTAGSVPLGVPGTADVPAQDALSVAAPRSTVVADLGPTRRTAAAREVASGWWLGGGLLLAAAVVLLAPVKRRTAPLTPHADPGR